MQIVENSPQAIKVGAQNVYYEAKGAFTGAVSAAMLQSVGCNFVLVGHSERRSVFGESNEDINRNLKQVQAHAMVPILCVGETLQEYELGELPLFFFESIPENHRDFQFPPLHFLQRTC